MKYLKLFVVTALMTVFMGMTAFAGTWQYDAGRDAWWYQRNNGTYPTSGWSWINGRCYYFDDAGWMAANGVTPDGYTVDASGAWVQNGVVQTQPTTTWLDTLQCDIPNGLPLELGDGVFSASQRGKGVFGLVIDEPELYSILVQYGGQAVADELFEELYPSLVDGQPATLISKDTITAQSGIWYHYLLNVTAATGEVLPCHMNIRLVNNQMHLIMLGGDNGEVDNTTYIMNWVHQ